MTPREDGPPLSIGYMSPGWPLDAFANGIITYIADMAEQLTSLGHRATILAGTTAGGEPGEGVYDIQRAYAAQGLVRRTLDRLEYRIAPRWADRRRTSRIVLGLLRRAIAERDLQIFEVEDTFGMAAWIKPAISIPVCVRLHGPWFLNGPAIGVPEDDEFRRRVDTEGRAIAAATAITSTSRDVLERTRSYYGLKLEHAQVIHPPTAPIPPADHWRPDGCEPRQILFIGRFDRHKGGDLIIEAFRTILRRVPEASLCFVGPDRGFIDDQGRRWNLEEFLGDRLPGALESGRVRLLGQQPFSALVALRRQAMITVVCSRYEVFGVTVTEAMALGCPIVAARVGGIPEIIRDGIDGVLHRVGDPDDLAAQILSLLENPGHAAELGRQAAARCEQQFHPAVIAARMIDFYRQVIRKASPH